MPFSSSVSQKSVKGIVHHLLSKGSQIVLIRHELISARFNAPKQIPLPMASSHPDIPKFFLWMPSLVLKTENKQQQDVHDFMCWQKRHLAG